MAVGAALFACAIAATSASAQVTERLPDLVSDQPQRLQLQTVAQPDGNHLLLRFDGFVHNAGQGALEMRGSNPVGTEYTNVVQRVYRSDSSFLDDSSRDPHIIFEPEDGHDHWHLKNAARYSLWNEAKTAEVAPAMKVGFCLIDSQRSETNGPSSAGLLHRPEQLLRPGRAHRARACSRACPQAGVICMTARSHSSGSTCPTSRPATTGCVPTSTGRRSARDQRGQRGRVLRLYRDGSVDHPGLRRQSGRRGNDQRERPDHHPAVHVIVRDRARHAHLPDHRPAAARHAQRRAWPDVHEHIGRLHAPPGWVGPDSFSYTVQNSSSSFPRYPTAASVTLNVGGVSPNVGISGAPVSLFTGTSARLLATVTADDPQVSWTVNGIPEGNSQVGTVDPFGLYVAPATPPPGGQVTIRATTRSGAFGEVTILIANPPAPQPAPSVAAAADSSVPVPPPPGGARPGGIGFRGIHLTTMGGAVVLTTRAAHTGIARVRVRDEDRQLGRCLVRATKGRTLTCRAPLPAYVSAANVRVVMTFRVHGRLVDVRRFKLGAAALGGAHVHQP